MSLAFEQRVRDRLFNHGLVVYHGVYSKNIGKIDALVETPSRIHIIECKMKSITPKSLAGNGVSLYTDTG